MPPIAADASPDVTWSRPHAYSWLQNGCLRNYENRLLGMQAKMLTKTQAFAKKTEARIAVCLYVRNAENDIQEWIAYHYLIGINSFVLYDNGSDDQTVKKARELSSIINTR